MPLPFTPDEFFGVFARYNEAVWPMQILLYVAALVVGALVLTRRISPRIVLSILGGLWMWMAIAYHWAFFATINPIARGFAVVFFVQGALLLIESLRTRAPSPPVATQQWLAGALIALALIVYPLLNVASGHVYPQMPTFGLPCPTTIFTFGVLVALYRPVPFRLAVIPLVWAAIGTSAALQLGVTEDLLLVLAGAVVALNGVRLEFPSEIRV
ncbi:MAG TPA: DUF6064 family protein [Gemmatimonadaceae bacterium]